MTTDRNRRIYELFSAVMVCDPAVRATRLEELCAGDAELRAEVERLLVQDAQASRGDFLAPRIEPRQGNVDAAPISPRLLGLDLHIRCPHCYSPLELDRLPRGEVICPACGSAFQLEVESTATWSSRSGVQRVGRFELIETVGLGAFGTVYKARDPHLDRIVAIKVPRSGSLATDQDRNRFRREA
jgi:hypothetical protein